jgi:hypothetical protein
MLEFFGWLQNSEMSTWVREAPTVWAFATVLTLHTFGMGILVGASSVISLRILGIGRGIPLGPMQTMFRMIWFGFWLNAVTGSVLFCVDAVSLGTSALFMVKLLLVALGIVTIVMIRRNVWGNGPDPVVVSSKAKLLAGASLAVWIAAITAGRLLAYVGRGTA